MSQAPHLVDTRFREAIEAFDNMNAQDPRRESVDGHDYPVELLYARRLSDWVERIAPSASEELRLAARALHLRRWVVPRQEYAMNRRGYHEWRDSLKERHADEAADILSRAGYPESFVGRVRDLITRVTFPDDPESRVIEDAVTILFLRHQLAELAAKTERAKTLRILRRAWVKLTHRGRALALCIDLGREETALVREALSNS